MIVCFHTTLVGLFSESAEPLPAAIRKVGGFGQISGGRLHAAAAHRLSTVGISGPSDAVAGVDGRFADHPTDGVQQGLKIFGCEGEVLK